MIGAIQTEKLTLGETRRLSRRPSERKAARDPSLPRRKWSSGFFKMILSAEQTHFDPDRTIAMKSRPSSSSKIFCALSVRGRKDGGKPRRRRQRRRAARRPVVGRPQKCATASVGGVFGARDGARRRASFLEPFSPFKNSSAEFTH